MICITTVSLSVDMYCARLHTTAMKTPVAGTATLACLLRTTARIEVMEHQEAGYFIHDWQELRDQVRQMIMKDDRYISPSRPVRCNSE